MDELGVWVLEGILLVGLESVKPERLFEMAGLFWKIDDGDEEGRFV